MSLWKRLSDLSATASDGGRSLWSMLAGSSSVPATASVRRAQTGVTFTIAVIALSAKMAKADGVVLGVEKDAFRKAFPIDPAETANVERLFTLAQQDVAGYQQYADQVAKSLDADPIMLTDVLDSLFHIATADRALHPGEDVFLAEVARRFGLSDSAYRHRRAHFVVDPSSPYDVLGLDPSVSEVELKARHRKLVRENHPDLLIGRGLPPEVIAVATRRLAAINNAYGVIARERRL